MSPGLHNTTTSYGSVTRALHWLTAALVLTAIPLGLFANSLPVSNGDELARAAFYFSLHKTLGVTIFLVALVRIAWALRQPSPSAMYPDRKIETFLAAAVHWSLYFALVLVPATGWISHAASTGFAPIWGPIGQSLPLVPKSDNAAQVFGVLHVLIGKVLAVSLLLHIAGAAKHLLIDHDDVFARMWSGKQSVPKATSSAGKTKPALLALGVYAATLAAGAVLGLNVSAPSPSGPSAEPSQVETDWAIQDGAIRITVRQLGSEVSGEFSDWIASIKFDPDSGLGEVDVAIAIASLSLGQVTANALGPDFFDVNNYPVANFIANISPDGQNFLATGELTIKGVTVAVDLPFELSVVGDQARMTGNTHVNRTDFRIGENYPDESGVGFAVDISVELVAQRSNSI